jgi:dipeptidase E
LRTAFRESGCDEIVKARLANDSLVFGGYSAGPCLLASQLPLLDQFFVSGVPRYPERLVTTGLDLLPFTIAPHYGPQPGAAGATKLTDYLIENHMPFIALRDGEALVGNGDTFRVVGGQS